MYDKLVTKYFLIKTANSIVKVENKQRISYQQKQTKTIFNSILHVNEK